MRVAVKRRGRRIALLAGACSLPLLCALGVTAARAQTNAAGAGEPRSSPRGGGQGATTEQRGAENGVAVGEIVVTATKRDMALRDIPATVNVVTGAQIAAIGPVTTTNDIIETVPGVRFNDYAGFKNSEIAIRGSGTERATGADPSVGLFANGAYVGDFGKNFQLIDSFDLSRAEILEGPQGALYGRNSEYGTVDLISQLPTFSNSGYVDDVYTFETQSNRLSAVVNVPVSDEVAVRIGVEDFTQSKGFIHNPDTNAYLDQYNGWLARAQIRFARGPLDVNLLAEAQRMDVPRPWANADISPSDPIAQYPLGFIQPRYEIPGTGIFASTEDVDSVVLTGNYDFGWGKLTSTTSWRDQHEVEDAGTGLDLPTAAMLEAEDLAAVAAGQLTVAKAKSAYPFTQKFATTSTSDVYEDAHLAGEALQNRLNWVVGLDALYDYGSGNTIDQTNPCATAAANQPADGTGGAPKGAFPGLCAGTPSAPICYLVLPNSSPCPNPYPVLPGTKIINWGDHGTASGPYYSIAPYGSLSYKIGWGFTLAGDIRYTDDHKSAHQSVYQLYTTTPYTFLTGGQILPKTYSYNQSNVSYTVTLSYKLPTPWDDMIYGKFGTGYRVGGFNFGNTPMPTCMVGSVAEFCNPNAKGVNSPAPVPVGYAPVIPDFQDETTESWEVGLKGDITGRAYLTLDAYLEQTYNALNAVGDGCAAGNSCETGAAQYTINAGTVHGWGVEAAIDTSWRVFDGRLLASVTGSTQAARFVSVPSNVAGVPFVGSPTPQNPRWLASATLDYRHRLFGKLEGFANLRYHGQWGGVQDIITTGAPPIPLSNYQKLDLRLGVDYGRLELAFIADNVTDETYVLYYGSQSTANPFPTITNTRWSLPRTFAVQATYKW